MCRAPAAGESQCVPVEVVQASTAVRRVFAGRRDVDVKNVSVRYG